MNDINQFSFHESTVLEFIQQNHTVTIALEGVFFSNNNYKVTIKCINVNKIEIDGKSHESIFMEADSGEILTLEVFENEMLVIIEWHDIKAKRPNVKCYRFFFENIQVDTSKLGPVPEDFFDV